MRPRVSPVVFIVAYHISFSLASIIANIVLALLPFVLSPANTISEQLAKMKSPSVDPISNSFRANLKELSATDSNLQNENFKLKMQLYHTRARLKRARADEDRRESYATPKIDNFYEEDNDDNSSRDIQERFDDDGFESDNQVIRALQDKLEERDNSIANLEEENRSLWDSHDDMKGQMQSQVAQLERLEAAKSSLHAKAEGSRLQIDAAVEAMEESQNNAQEARNRLAEANLQIKREKAQVKSLEENLESERRLHQATETFLQEQQSEVKSIEKSFDTILKERDEARQMLHCEIERREMWEASRGEEGRAGFLARESNQMDSLLAGLDERRGYFETNNKYEENWRENVNDYLKDCLKALYQLEMEVDVKRRDFVTKSSHLVEQGRSVLA